MGICDLNSGSTGPLYLFSYDLLYLPAASEDVVTFSFNTEGGTLLQEEKGEGRCIDRP